MLPGGGVREGLLPGLGGGRADGSDSNGRLLTSGCIFFLGLQCQSDFPLALQNCFLHSFCPCTCRSIVIVEISKSVPEKQKSSFNLPLS